MKIFIKTILLIFAVVSIQSCVMKDDEHPIPVDQLPATVQQFINTHFGDRQITLAKESKAVFGKKTEVIFSNGDKVEFDPNDEWKEIECTNSQVPASLLPDPIKAYLTENFPTEYAKEFSRSRTGYEVKLSNKMEVEFTNDFDVYDVDD